MLTCSNPGPVPTVARKNGLLSYGGVKARPTAEGVGRMSNTASKLSLFSWRENWK